MRLSVIFVTKKSAVNGSDEIVTLADIPNAPFSNHFGAILSWQQRPGVFTRSAEKNARQAVPLD